MIDRAEGRCFLQAAGKNKRDDGAETRADFGAFRGAESAALPRYYTHGTTRTVLHARYYTHGATRSYTRVLYAGGRMIADPVAKVFPASGMESVRYSTAIPQDYFASAGDSPDFDDRHARDLRGYGSIPGRGEQEFVIFAAVQGELEIYFVRWFAHAGPRNGFCFHFGAHATFFADVGKVGGESVAGVDHGRG